MLTLALLNHLIAQNVEAQAQWQQHQGRVLTWTLPLTTLHGRIDAQGFWQPEAAEADVVVIIPAAALTKMVSGQTVGVGDVVLEGDRSLGMAVLPLLQQLRYDWRDDLARLLGDMAGGAVAGQIDQWVTGIKSSKDNIMAQIRDYAQEHDSAILGRQTFSHFSRQVACLRDDEARLSERLKRLQQRLNNKPE
ncbi:SCP2 domain-containing protein [Neisseriaceae bacterium ESL0693]|nr:SCP2 domain-containing protein [Neisseriaceae bacterium ESL0693]